VPYDIDVKGSAVSGHVVAPTDVPGVESSYELVQDGEIIGVIDPQDVLQDITYDGKQALKYRPESGGVDWDGDLHQSRRRTSRPVTVVRCSSVGKPRTTTGTRTK